MASFPAARDRALAYGIYGGTPRYLATIDPAASLAENAVRSALSPNGNVRIQVETVVAQEHGLRDLGEYNAILSAIGSGATLRNEIAMKTGLAQTFAFRSRLEKLEELGLIESTRNFGASASEPHRYRLSDPALRFYYSIVDKYRSELELDDPMEIWRRHIERELDAYMGLIFERVSRQAYFRMRAARELPIVREWGRWEGLDRDRQQIEIDIVARRTDGSMLTGAVKWNKKGAGTLSSRKAHRYAEATCVLGLRLGTRGAGAGGCLSVCSRRGLRASFPGASGNRGGSGDRVESG